MKEHKRWPVAFICAMQIYMSIAFHFYYDAFPKGFDIPIMRKLSCPTENDFALVEQILRPRRYIGINI